MIDDLYIALGLVVAVLIIYKIFRTRQRHAAAMNVVFAKYTFEKLSEDKKNLVRGVAKDLVLSSPTKRRGYVNEVERYGWFALAMNELGMPSKVPDNPQWNKVKNPYTAIKPGDRLFAAICVVLKSDYGIDLEISKQKNTMSHKSEQDSENKSV